MPIYLHIYILRQSPSHPPTQLDQYQILTNHYLFFILSPPRLELIRLLFYQRIFSFSFFFLELCTCVIFDFSSKDREVNLFFLSKLFSNYGTKELILRTISSRATLILSPSTLLNLDSSVSTCGSLTNNVAWRIFSRMFLAGSTSSLLILTFAYDLYFYVTY